MSALDPQGRYVPVFHRGQWTEVLHPDQALDGDVEENMNQVGYARVLHLASDDFGTTAVTITVWGNGRSPEQIDHKNPSPDAPAFVLDVHLGLGHVDELAAQDIVDVLELLARWAPIVTAANVTDHMYRQELGKSPLIR